MLHFPKPCSSSCMVPEHKAEPILGNKKAFSDMYHRLGNRGLELHVLRNKFLNLSKPLLPHLVNWLKLVWGRVVVGMTVTPAGQPVAVAHHVVDTQPQSHINSTNPEKQQAAMFYIQQATVSPPIRSLFCASTSVWVEATDLGASATRHLPLLSALSFYYSTRQDSQQTGTNVSKFSSPARKSTPVSSGTWGQGRKNPSLKLA